MTDDQRMLEQECRRDFNEWRRANRLDDQTARAAWRVWEIAWAYGYGTKVDSPEATAFRV